MGAYSVNIVALSNQVHDFEFEIGNKFFGEYGTDLISEGSFHVNVALNKHETFIEAEFKIKGKAVLVCDRSLDTFDFPIESNHHIVFKFGDSNEEMSDEIIMIHRDTDTLELGQYIYEFLALAIPMKKLHPRFHNETEDDEDSNGKIVYSSKKDSDDDKGDDEIDPRWNILKNLK